MSEATDNNPATSSHEWTNFIILAVILLGTILVVALARPFIFNHVVPVVMGEGQRTAPLPSDTEAYPAKATGANEEAYPAAEALSPVVPIIEEAPAAEPAPAAAENEAANGEELPTAVATISHTVQPGDSLIKLARRYGVTVEAILAANSISNPNHIEVGTTLLIPQP